MSISHQLGYAAFFSEGLHDAGYDKVLGMWDKGCVELIHEIVEYATFMDAMVIAAERAIGDEYGHPGVYCYEVASAFGWWFGAHILHDAQGESPSQAACHAWIIDHTHSFFAQRLVEPQIDQLRKTLQTAGAAFEAALRMPISDSVPLTPAHFAFIG